MVKTVLLEENEKAIGFANVIIYDDIWFRGRAAILNMFYIRFSFRSVNNGKK